MSAVVEAMAVSFGRSTRDGCKSNIKTKKTTISGKSSVEIGALKHQSGCRSCTSRCQSAAIKSSVEAIPLMPTSPLGEYPALEWWINASSRKLDVAYATHSPIVRRVVEVDNEQRSICEKAREKGYPVKFVSQGIMTASNNHFRGTPARVLAAVRFFANQMIECSRPSAHGIFICLMIRRRKRPESLKDLSP